MTSPNDPGHPVQPGSAAAGEPADQSTGQQSGTPPPGWGSPPDPNQPGWGAPPAGGQPGWGAPPAGGQPGWGAPPPQPGWGTQPQPGWGAPPAGGQPGWGTPPQQPGWGAPPAGGQPGWGTQPQPGWGPPPNQNRSFASRHGCLLAFLIVLGLVVVGVGGCVVIAWPYAEPIVKLELDLGTTRVSSISISSDGGETIVVIHVKPGYEGQATTMACGIVRNDLAGTKYANDPFELVDQNGNILATNLTPCP